MEKEHDYQVSFMLNNTRKMWWTNVPENVLLLSTNDNKGCKIHDKETCKSVFYAGLCYNLKGKLGSTLNPDACYIAYIARYTDKKGYEQYKIVDCVEENT